MPKGKSKSKTKFAGNKLHNPIADQVLKMMRAHTSANVVDLSAVKEGRKNAEAMQKTVASREELAGLHPAHAIYVYAQNQTSVMAEQLTALPEMERFAELIGNAEEEYQPDGPPISPLTNSFFCSWALFDACVGVGQETLGTTTMAVGRAFGMHEELVRVIGLLQESRMAVCVHEGMDGSRVVLRELVTNRRCCAICPSGYDGRAGELWYARVLPSPLAGLDDHVVFTTPYVLLDPGEREWLAYFERNLRDSPPDRRLAAYERHMKWGPARNYWTEYVFEAYVNHQHDAVFLRGLPDVPESRPHAQVNW